MITKLGMCGQKTSYKVYGGVQHLDFLEEGPTPSPSLLHDTSLRLIGLRSLDTFKFCAYIKKERLLIKVNHGSALIILNKTQVNHLGLTIVTS